MRNCLNEYELMNMLNHTNILKQPPSILLEFFQENLDDAVKNKALSNIQIVFIIYKIAKGMK